MSVKHVLLASDVYFVCLTHAFSTEKEEVMGLLIGENDSKAHIVSVSSAYMLTRSDKRPDRVEISPEQLTEAAMHAEQLSKEVGRELTIVGWYHSHPHITVWPSHVDLRTQASYQLMGNDFIGIIISVFNTDKTTKLSQIEVICFQTVDVSPEGQPPQYQRQDIPFEIKPTRGIAPHNLRCVTTLPRILCNEEQASYQAACGWHSGDMLTDIHNSAVFTKCIGHVLDVQTDAIMHAFEGRLLQNKRELRAIKDEKRKLQQQLIALRETKMEQDSTTDDEKSMDTAEEEKSMDTTEEEEKDLIIV